VNNKNEGMSIGPLIEISVISLFSYQSVTCTTDWQIPRWKITGQQRMQPSTSTSIDPNFSSQRKILTFRPWSMFTITDC